MFSSIKDAWHNDPVREMTNKLKTNYKNQSQHADLFNFNKNKNNLSSNEVNLSDESINLLSDDNNTIDIYSLESNNSTLAPINFKKNYRILPSKSKETFNIDTSDANIFSDSLQDSLQDSLKDSLDHSKCSFNTRHLKKCDQCNQKLKNLIDKKVNRKINDIVLEEKMKQLNTVTQNVQSNNQLTRSDTWKETLIIIIGAVIAIFIILLAFKALNK